MYRIPVVFSLLSVAFLASVGCAAESDGAPGETPNRKTDKATHQHPANRLAHETSPYLLLHAHNPVDWFPWGPEAFEKAQQENKPIFLSIGYSSCFWCHVMERETFSDEETAAYMNEHFVNIKVDREERPDVDDIYMLALQVYYRAIGSPPNGGWPLSMFLTPTGKPMAGGTYFPPRARRGLPGFLAVLQKLHESWTDDEERMTAAAEAIAGEVRRVSAPGESSRTVPLGRSLVDQAIAAVEAQFDPEYGGLEFDPRRPNGPKFPVPTRLMLLQSQIGNGDAVNGDAVNGDGAKGDGAKIVAMLENTLDHMLRGGIRDHLGGGFHRYSTDRQWMVPHFEKMLYDNAQLAEVYSNAYARTGEQRYRDVAEQTFAFVLREMTSPDGGFYSALDAETDGIEGQHYVWSKDEIAGVLGESDAALFNDVYGVNEPERFEHGHVLHLPRPIIEAAVTHGIPAAELRDRLSVMRDKLLVVREQRPALLKDDKVLTSWNGLMIRALARGGEVLNRPDLIAAGERAARFVLTNMRDEEGRLLRTHRDKLSKLNAYLDDYAFVVSGLLALHRATGQQEWLDAARQLTDDQIDLFWDEEGKAFFFTSDHHEKLLARTKNAYDNVIPSGNSMSVRNLVRLAELTGNADDLTRAGETLALFAPKLENQSGALTFMAVAVDEYLAATSASVSTETDVDSDSDANSDSGPVSDSDSESAAETLPPGESAVASDAADKPVVVRAAKFPQQGTGEPLVLAARTDPRLKDAKVSAKAYLSVDKLPAGGKAQVAVVLAIKDGWHINTNPARPDFLVPTELILKAARKSKLSQIAYPKGHDFRMEGFDEPLSVFEKQVLLKGTIEAPRAAAGATEELELTIHYQACDNRRCLRPTDATLKLRVPVAAAGADVKTINQRLFAPKGKGN